MEHTVASVQYIKYIVYFPWAGEIREELPSFDLRKAPFLRFEHSVL